MERLPELPERILDAVEEAVLACDRSGVVRYWNPAAERLFGFSRDEAVGASMELIIPQRLRKRHWSGWEKAIAAGTTSFGAGQLLAVPAMRRDGRQISIEFSIQLLKDADGRVDHVVAFIRDVTERRARDQALSALSRLL
jgi:PAS domain S-box-containing protein